MAIEQLPAWASRVLSGDSLERIEAAVREAERKTSGEIVPVLVRRSSAVGHVPLVLAFIFLATFYLALLVLRIPIANVGLLIGTVVSVFLAYALGKVLPIQRVLISARDEKRQAEMRAEVEFFEAKVHKTEARTGILLFVSLFERRAVVLADKAISEKLPPDTWEGIVQALVEGLKKGHAENGFVSAIGKAGEILAAHFPRAAGDVNEVFDGLVIKD